MRYKFENVSINVMLRVLNKNKCSAAVAIIFIDTYELYYHIARLWRIINEHNCRYIMFSIISIKTI